jgi:hypothetical protein
MIRKRRTLGEVVDELLQTSRWLGIAHACLGVAAAFVYWVRPGTFTPHLAIYQSQDPSPIFVTFIAWIPYVVAFTISKAMLAGRNPKAVLVYILFASMVTIGAAGLYLDLFGMHAALTPIEVAGCVTITLLVGVGICAAIWRRDTSDC